MKYLLNYVVGPLQICGTKFIPYTLAPQQSKTGKSYSLPVDPKRTVMQSDDVSTASQGKLIQHKTPQS